MGVVAHFYMDPQVQGVLTSAGARWPHIAISDSLVMADKAVRMAEAGCRAIAVLGVDFMSENVRAILDEAGHRNVAVSHQLTEVGDAWTRRGGHNGVVSDLCSGRALRLAGGYFVPYWDRAGHHDDVVSDMCGGD